MRDHRLYQRPLGTVFCEGAIWNTENFTSCRGIWFVAWIVRGIKAPIAIELPLLVSDPSQPAALDRIEVASNQFITGRRDNYGARAIANHRERFGIELAHMLVIAG